MKRKISFLVLAAIGVLAACNGNQKFAPIAQQAPTSAQADVTKLPFTPPGMNPHAGIPGCNAPTYKPKAGPFIVFVGNGSVKKGAFKSQPSETTVWFEERIKKSKPQPTPSNLPTAPPTDQPTYFYFGQYTLKNHKQSGCAILVATQSGKPFTGSKFGAFAVGAPLIKYPTYYKVKILAHGPVSIKISKLSSQGGSGKATLFLSNGNPFDTATVTLTSRLP